MCVCTGKPSWFFDYTTRGDRTTRIKLHRLRVALHKINSYFTDKDWTALSRCTCLLHPGESIIICQKLSKLRDSTDVLAMRSSWVKPDAWLNALIERNVTDVLPSVLQHVSMSVYRCFSNEIGRI